MVTPSGLLASQKTEKASLKQPVLPPYIWIAPWKPQVSGINISIAGDSASLGSSYLTMICTFFRTRYEPGAALAAGAACLAADDADTWGPGCAGGVGWAGARPEYAVTARSERASRRMTRCTGFSAGGGGELPERGGKCHRGYMPRSAARRKRSDGERAEDVMGV